MDQDFISRRSPVLGARWGLSSDQPLASKIGADVLTQGGNAADAAVAICAAICVTQPSSVSLGGDAFCLFYDAKTKDVAAYNGSGPSPGALTLDLVQSKGHSMQNPIPINSPLTITVPGLPAALQEIVELYGSGKFSLAQLLKPSIELAEQGFPVAPLSALFWQRGEEDLLKSQNGGELLLPNGKAPPTGHIIKLACMARSLKLLADGGKEAFYLGEFAEEMCASIQEQGGLLTVDDLRHFLDSPPDKQAKAISTSYKGKRVWQIPPNSEGFVALMALNILEGFDLQAMGRNSAEYVHTLLESFRLAFADGFYYNAQYPPKELDQLLSKDYANQRRQMISPDRCLPPDVAPGCPPGASDTVCLGVVDQDGNACSFLATCCNAFGSTVIPKGCGFAMQNRGISFSLNPNSRNILGPSKRTFHTNMPSMVTDEATGVLLTSIGVMGYLLQPQGLVQVLLNMIEWKMEPQEALNQLRACLAPTYAPSIDAPFSEVWLEGKLGDDIGETLEKKGHKNVSKIEGYKDRTVFGRGHVIATGGTWWEDCGLDNQGVWCGSDPRGDGIAIAW